MCHGMHQRVLKIKVLFVRIMTINFQELQKDFGKLYFKSNQVQRICKIHFDQPEAEQESQSGYIKCNQKR